MLYFWESDFAYFLKVIFSIFICFCIIFGTIIFISSKSPHERYYLEPMVISNYSGHGSYAIQKYSICYDRFLIQDRMIAVFDNQNEAIEFYDLMEK